jgi:hypothetical protein
LLRLLCFHNLVNVLLAGHNLLAAVRAESVNRFQHETAIVDGPLYQPRSVHVAEYAFGVVQDALALRAVFVHGFGFPQ